MHGDFKLGNTLIAGGRVRAVLDWEMSTLGDPLTDLALFLLYGQFGALDLGGDTGGDTEGDIEDDTAEEHLPVAEVADRYAGATGLDVSRLGWHIGLACFKLAVISEGIHFRYTQGLTVGDGFDEIGAHVAPLVAHGLDALDTLEG